MPKRKPQPPRRVWARMIGPEWYVHLVDGEVLRRARDLTVAAARERALALPVFRVSYLAPVLVLTGDRAAIDAELAQPCDGAENPECNLFALFRGDRGTEAVVIEHQH